jgi:menaquinone-dependent protoporphyrinogen IX oxidase
VAYASRAGSTAGVQVDVRRMQDVKDLAPYRAVVAGSAIQGGPWLRPPGATLL